jgi:peptidoglycan/LPS O-acetylase OafA/YrhL
MNYNLHSKTLDCLRGVAAAAVFFSHSDASHLATNEWLTANKGFLGTLGVYIFFCLSGYLIWRSGTRLIGAPDGVKLYTVHRITRLIPLYVINLFVVVVLVGCIGSNFTPSNDIWMILRHLVLSQDLYPSVSRAINPVLWTLTHEALFYVLAALMLIAKFRNHYLILLASLTLYGVCQTYGISDYFRFSQTFYAFALGIFIAEADKSKSLGLCLLTIVLAVYTFVDTKFSNYSAPMTGVAIALSCISLTIDKKCNRFVSVLMSPAVFLGVISYSLYIWHYQIINIMEYHFAFFNNHIPGWSQFGMVRAIVTVSICVGISYISYVLIEKPSMGRLRITLERKVGIALTPALGLKKNVLFRQ